MKTKYLDAEIERLNLLERNEELTDWGKEMLIELKEIKQALLIPRVSNCATSMEEILNEAQRRKAKHSVQYADYSLETWTVANDLLEHRKNDLLADGSVRKVRIEYEM